MRLHYSYDDANRRIGLALPDGQQQSWGYDPAGRVNGVIQPGGGSWTVAHNGAGQPTMASVPSGGSQVWGYDPAGRATSATWLQAGNPTFSQVATLDAAGQRKQLADSWGTVTYGYDRAGRLTSAGYPDGSTEADTYDPAGNRTAITATTPLSGTAVTTNSYDAADQLSTAAATGGPQPGSTTYAYDGNGNQTDSSGPAGTTSNTFNDLNQLTRIVGPGTNLTLLYDGQGDRLRSYERGTPTWTLRNEAQDLAGGLSALVSDGTADYAYLSPGDGSAPLSAYAPGTSRATYLGTDLLGSVRLATDPAGATIGAGAYDAWGNARPYTGGSGATQLAGLQGVAPFGYAGQQRDAGPGTYAMRARRYDPATGRFQSQDPLAYSPQVPVTINPYEYAGDMPTGVTDPSGQGWALPGSSLDFGEESNIAGRSIESLLTFAGAFPGEIQRTASKTSYVGGYDTSPAQYWIRVFRHALPPCQGGPSLSTVQGLSGARDAYAANIIDRSGDGVWDIEHAEAFTGGLGAQIQQRLVDNANRNGYWWKTSRSNELPFANGSPQIYSARDGVLHRGSGYPEAFGLRPELINIVQLGLGIPGPPSRVNYRPGRIMPRPVGGFIVAWEQESGLLLYKVLDLRGLSAFVSQEHQADPGLGLAALGVEAQGSELTLRDYGTPLGQLGKGEYLKNILVVGESDTFEYSRNLATKHPDYRIVSTRYGSGAAPGNVPRNMTVLDNIDATNLQGTLANTAAAGLKFDATVFNNPFTAGSSATIGEDKYAMVTRIVVGYWKSSSDVISSEGTIRLNINPFVVRRSPSLSSALSTAEYKGSFGGDDLYAPFSGMTSGGVPLKDYEATAGGKSDEAKPLYGAGLSSYPALSGRSTAIRGEVMDELVTAVERIRREYHGYIGTHYLFVADEQTIHHANREEWIRYWDGRHGGTGVGRGWLEAQISLLNASTTPFQIPHDFTFFLEYYGGMDLEMGDDEFSIFGLGWGEGSRFPSILAGFDGEPRYGRGWQEIGDLIIRRGPAGGGWKTIAFAMDLAGILQYGAIFTAGINTMTPIWDMPSDQLLCVADSFSAWMNRVASKDWAPFL